MKFNRPIKKNHTGDFHNISRDNFAGTNFLNTRFVRSDNFAHFRFVFFQSFDG